MAPQTRNKFNTRLIFILIGGLFVGYIVRQYCSSLIFREKDRINIGVYTQTPFVYSYNPAKKLAIITYFNPNFLVKVPGGYDWYKIGSLGLLGKIEHNKEKILKQAFAELVGTRIDYVFYEKDSKVFENDSQSFANFFDQLVKETLFSKKFSNSVHNLFDKVLIKQIFFVRADHQIFLNTYDLGIEEKGKVYYKAEKLDSKLKGLFYHESLLNMGLNAVIVVNKTNFDRADQAVRQIESLGIKVIEVEVNNNLNNKKCLIAGTKDQAKALKKLGRIFNCQVKTQKSFIIKYTL